MNPADIPDWPSVPDMRSFGFENRLPDYLFPMELPICDEETIDSERTKRRRICAYYISYHYDKWGIFINLRCIEALSEDMLSNIIQESCSRYNLSPKQILHEQGLFDGLQLGAVTLIMKMVISHEYYYFCFNMLWDALNLLLVESNYGRLTYFEYFSKIYSSPQKKSGPDEEGIATP